VFVVDFQEIGDLADRREHRRSKCEGEITNWKSFKITPICGDSRGESYIEMRIFLQSDTSVILKVAEVPKSILQAGRLTELLWYSKKLLGKITKLDPMANAHVVRRRASCRKGS